MRRKTRLLVLLGVMSTLLVGSHATAADITFETSVRPILKAHCWQCHGEEEELQGSLDARLARLLLAGGDSGPAIIAGNHSESLLYQRVSSGEMPPGDTKLEAEQVELLARWIDAGARVARSEPENLPLGDVFTEEDRDHWSFQPVRRPSPPEVRNSELVFTPIDSFLLARLEAAGLSYAPEADRATWLRRLSFDLVGLPPTPEAVERFVNDSSPEAYERQVDELLASPAYGERWARHWLDVVGYADSEGYTAADTPRPWAYRYRDYVIRSLNDDKPWNEFLVEQLAGDELLTPPYANLTSQQADALIATGMLRMGPDGTADSGVDQQLARNEVLADTVKIVSTAVLGLTVGCAQCHAHRYDPISHRDYYRFRALFEPAYDCQNWRPPAARLVSLWSDETRAQVAAVDSELADIEKRRTAELDALVQETFERELAKLPAEVHEKARAARATAAKERSEEQQQLIKDYPFLNVDRGSVYLYLPDRLNGFTKKWETLVDETRQKRPADDYVRCLTEVPGQVPVTHLFDRGDHNQPREEVAPGELTILTTLEFSIEVDDPELSTTGRRLAYARHLTDGKHPLVGRVLVNRFWRHHFGRGLVATLGDFGALGEPPSHPELLDWLADDFVRGGWQLKRWHKLIVLSRAYRQSSARRDELEAVDPENRLLGRMSVQRLEAETIRDALLAVSGRLSTKMYGPPVPVMPDDVGQIVLGVDTRDSAGRPTGKVVPLGEEALRRGIYVQVRRSMPLGMFEPFDAPVMAPNCELRPSSTVASQSLLLMNGAAVVEHSSAMAERIEREVGADPATQFCRAWQLAYCCAPSADEVAAGVEFLSAQTAALQPAAPADEESSSTDAKAAEKAGPAQLALANLCQALLISNRFLYVD
ncbi:MAG: PSD1 and planctomycete cytochrome C domain-containing protein [Pirellulales bacterium]